jgi:hypothetical protein
MADTFQYELFAKTQLFDDILAWEANHIGYVVLRSSQVD